ncbi:glycosyltransferase [Actinomyces urogenitalis]|uniref:glycosyltransferase n=1 Tax=Actinomyces urogenitalis TaxID=103621 RepID=UPI00189ACBBF|nr:glycosyltransferase [Actinomyces urogenitalis]
MSTARLRDRVRQVRRQLTTAPDLARRRGVLLATRIHLPEAAAASFRLDGVEKALAGHDVPVRVLTTTPPAAAGAGNGTAKDSQEVQPAYRDPEGVSVSRWPALRDASGYLRGYVPYMSFDVPLLGRLLVQPRPDAVLVEPPPTTGVVVRVAAALRGLPYVWYAPDVWSVAATSTSAPGVVLAAVRAMESFAVRGAQRVIAVNEEVADKVRQLGAHDVEVVPNGIDTSVFDTAGDLPRAQERQEMGITGPYAVYAGTASEWQDAGVFARALAAVRRDHPSAQVLYLGQGSDWEAIAQAAAQIPAGADGAPAVVMHGLMPPEQAARWQRGAACALVSIKPGLGYDFAYPTKVLAALACGTPVLYAGPGPVTDDVAAHDLGWVARHEDGDVARALSEAFAADARLDPAGRQERAARLHGWVEAHRSLRATGEAVAHLMREVVLERRARPDLLTRLGERLRQVRQARDVRERR